MRKSSLLLIPLLLIALAPFSLAQEAYVVDFVNYKGFLSFSKVIRGEGAGNEGFEGTPYRAFVTDEGGKTLSQTLFFSPDSAGPFRVFLPYDEQGYRVQIKDNEGGEVFSFPVAHFASLCPDSVCQEQESAETCPLDCPTGGKDDYCDRASEGRCDPDCGEGEDVDCEAERPTAAPAPAQPVNTPRSNVPLLPPDSPSLSLSPGRPSSLMLILTGALAVVLVTLLLIVLVVKKGGSEDDARMKEAVRQWKGQGYPPGQIERYLSQQGYGEKAIRKLMK